MKTKIIMSYYLKFLMIIFTFFVGCCLCANSQVGKLPPFQMMQVNNKLFKAQNLPMGKPILIVYFSPECDRCEIFTKELVEKVSALKNTSIAMVTYYPVENVSRFVNKFSLNRFANIYVGTEGDSLFLRGYYKIIELPFAALYTKNGGFVKSYSKNIHLNNIINIIQKMK